MAAIGGARHPDGLQERGERIFPPRRLRKAELVLQHGDGRAVGVSVRKALLELGGIIPARQINPLTQKAPIGEAEHCLSNYGGSLHIWGLVHWRFPSSFLALARRTYPPACPQSWQHPSFRQI